VPVASAPVSIDLAGDFSDWKDVGPDYLDYTGETDSRNWPSTFGNLPNYRDDSGRNDFRLLKVARDARNLYFLAQCRSNITSYTGSNWMVLFLDVDQSRATGWEGFDYAVNLGARDGARTSLSRCDGTNWSWRTVRSDLVWKVAGNQLMFAVPREALGLTREPLNFDFHWGDNFQTNDISGFFLSGDSAPERRFNYRYQTAAGATRVLCADNFDAGPQPFWGTAFEKGGWTWRTNGAYAGSCAVAAVTNGIGQPMLTTKIDTSGLESFRVSFHFKLTNVGEAQNFNLEYFNGTNWVSARNLGRDQFYPDHQAWGYNERSNVWLLCVDARRRESEARFFRRDFALRLNATGLTTAHQAVIVDDVLATGVEELAREAGRSARLHTGTQSE
jgi:hypothetical protein